MSATVSIVGAGRVGKVLGRRLHEMGWRIGMVVTQSNGTARSATRAIGAGRPTASLSSLILASDIVLIATPDDRIANVAATLAKLGDHEWRGKIVLHTSGALGVDALKPLGDAGAATGSLHPMQTFSKQGTTSLEGRVFGIDGDATALKAARKMVRQLGGIPVRLSGANKAAYHAAGSLACAHVLAVMETATRLLMAQGFTRRQSIRALLPLTRQTLDNFERIGARMAWTGPIARGDFVTIKRHVETLQKFPPEYLDAYVALSRLAAAVLSNDPRPVLRKLDTVMEALPGLPDKVGK